MTDTNNISITPGTGSIVFNSGTTSNLGLTNDQVNSIIANIIIANTGTGGDLYSGKTGNNIFNFRTIEAGSGIQIIQKDDTIEVISTGVVEAGSTLAKVATTGSYNDLIDLPNINNSFSNLEDTDISSPINGQIISYNNGKWTNENITFEGVLTGAKSIGFGIDIWDTSNTSSVLPLKTLTAGDGIALTIQDNTIVISSDNTDINTWLSGSSIPTPSMGTNGDFYLDVSTGNVYEKLSSEWVLSINIVGPQGPQGLQGLQGQRGSLWTSGNTAPSSTTAMIGDMYLNTSNGYVYQYTTTGWYNLGNIIGPTGNSGSQGPAGANGENGQRGSLWTSGNTAPSSTTAMIGDMYLNTSNGYVYQYTTTGWDQISYTVGPQGSTGQSGSPGQRGSTWTTGTINPSSTTALSGDMYLNTSTGEVFQYLSSSWSNTDLNLIGPIGPQGSQGPQGPQGVEGESLLNKGEWVSGTTYSTNNYCFAPSSLNSDNTSMYVYNSSDPLVSTIAPGSDKSNWIEISGIQGQRGSTWTTGTINPSSTTSLSGDMYLNTSTGEVFQYNGSSWNDTSYSATGPQGIQGVPGPRGTQLTVGNGTPSSADAIVGDSYIDIDTGYIYNYLSTGWATTNHSVKGQSGNNGTIWTFGSIVPSGSGNSGDFYLDTSTGDVYQYNGSSWSIIDNIQGPQGIPGPQGPQGPQGNPGSGLNNKGTWVSGTVYNTGDYVFDVISATDSSKTMWIFYGSTSITSTTNPYLDSSNWIEFNAPSGQRGTGWSAGGSAPTTTDNIIGDMYLNTSTGDVYQYQTSGWVKLTTIIGAPGSEGPTGPRGSYWSSGVDSTPPDNALIYDQYLDTSTGDVYQYNGSSWGNQGNIKGPSGSNGSKWINGNVDPSTSTTGMTIGDYYLNVISGNIFQYVINNSVTSWTNIGNIKGPAGSLTADFATYESSTSTLTFTCNNIIMSNSLPTTDPNNNGQLWNNNGVVCISSGI